MTMGVEVQGISFSMTAESQRIAVDLNADADTLALGGPDTTPGPDDLSFDFKAIEESEGVGKPNPGKLTFEHYYDKAFDGDSINDLLGGSTETVRPMESLDDGGIIIIGGFPTETVRPMESLLI